MLVYYSNLTSNRRLLEAAAERLYPMEAPLEILSVIRCSYHNCTLHGNRCGGYVTPFTVLLSCPMHNIYLSHSIGIVGRWSDQRWDIISRPWSVLETMLVWVCTQLEDIYIYIYAQAKKSVSWCNVCTCVQYTHFFLSNYVTSYWLYPCHPHLAQISCEQYQLGICCVGTGPISMSAIFPWYGLRPWGDSDASAWFPKAHRWKKKNEWDSNPHNNIPHNTTQCHWPLFQITLCIWAIDWSRPCFLLHLEQKLCSNIR